MVTNFSQCPPIDLYFQKEVGSLIGDLKINFILSMCIIIIFIILKKITWSCQHEVVHLYKDSWISLFYRDVFDLIPSYELQNMRCTYKQLDRNMTFIQMLLFCFFSLTVNDIRKRCGIDAVQYLQFLKWIIIYNFINTIIVLAFVLPANFQGDQQRNTTNIFVRSMMNNVSFRQEWIFWIYVCVQAFLMMVGLLTIRSFSAGLYSCEPSKWAKRSVVVTDTDVEELLTAERIKQYFKNILQQEEIVDIKLVYNYRRLIETNRKLENFEEALALCQHISRIESREVYVKKICWHCHHYCSLSCNEYMENGTKYYKEKMDHLKYVVSTELSILTLKIFKIAYVTFKSEDSAYKVITEKEHGKTAKPDNEYWKIRKAEDPTDIIWRSLTRRGSDYTLRTTLVNTTVCLIAIFATTPTIVLTGIDKNVIKTMEEQGALFRYFPVFLAWLFSVLLTMLVTYSSELLDYETRSAKNRSIMVKTFLFLLLAVIILPILGLTSVSAFLVWTFREINETALVWRCLFLPGNGYFFVSYIMTSGCIGNMVQILRLPEMAFFLFGILISKSEVEKVILRKSCISEFMYGVQYAYGLLILFLVTFYSLQIPFVAPVGLLYFLIKYAVDRYNICFAYLPSKASNKVHSLAIQFMIAAFIIAPIGLFFFVYIRGGWCPITYAFVIILGSFISLSLISMNPLDLNFIPKSLLMPHRVSPHIMPHCYEEDTFLEKEVYQPYDYRKYTSKMTSVDEYGNILESQTNLEL